MFYRFFALFALFTLNVATLADSADLPDIGDSAGNITPSEEYRTGEAVIRNIRRAGGVLDDPLVQNYLDELGYRLVAASETEQPFHFFLIKDLSINAFALPGGFIGVNAGLILATKSENEFAGVMAHEIAHVTQRHHARRYEQNDSNIPILATLIAAMVLGSQNNEIGQAALASVAAGSAQKQINFTRANEKEADRIGIELLKDAEFNPYGMVTFFETMDKQARLYGDSIPEFLRSHPVNPSRIADASHRARQYSKKLVKSSINYHLIRARLNVLATDNKIALLRDYESQMKQGNYQHQLATQYGYALTLLANKKLEVALKQAKQLVKNNPEQIALHLLKARIETESKQYKAAIKTFKKLLRLHPGNSTINIFYAETLLKANKADLAHDVLQKQVSSENKTPILYQLLAESQAKLNMPAQSHQSLSEHFYLQGRTHDAIKQIEIGLKLSKSDFYLTSRLEARIKKFKQELHDLNKK